MIPVVVLGLAVDVDLQSVVLLSPLTGSGRRRTVLPIWVGREEAALLSIALNGVVAPRPITHDLLQNLVAASGAVLEGVEIPRVEDGVFLAELHLAVGADRVVLDCRPVDGIAMALRCGAPLFVSEAVLAAEGSIEDLIVDDGAAEADRSDDLVSELSQLLDGARPDDRSR